jgi:hypothetical protein
MVEVRNTRRTRLVLSTELDIVMLNAVDLRLFTVRLPLRLGEAMVLAALNSTSGRPTNRPVSTQGILARFRAITDAKERASAVTGIRDTRLFVTRTAVGSIPTEQETKISMDLGPIFRWILQSLSR